jgi:hypothetical protein
VTRLLSYVRRHHVALLALFVALGGVSYAAVKLPNNSVGRQQLKPRAVTPPKLAPATVELLKGQTGDAGAQGAVGAKGDQGEPGAKGDQGDPGPTTALLPSGQTETGPFVARDRHGTTSDPIDISIGFPLSLSAGVPAYVVAPTLAAVPQCTGSAENPTAAPGSLCVYVAVSGNSVIGGGRPVFVDPVTTTQTTTTRPYGVILRNIVGGPGDSYLFGAWAVTAP